MKIEFDPSKRVRTLQERGVDMARADKVFEDAHITFADIRFEYGENRWITIGHLDGRMVVLAWTPHDETRRIISMRKANEREQRKFGYRFNSR